MTNLGGMFPETTLKCFLVVTSIRGGRTAVDRMKPCVVQIQVTSEGPHGLETGLPSKHDTEALSGIYLYCRGGYVSEN